MKEYLKLLRVKHYIKNLLIFLAVICSGAILEGNNLVVVSIAFVSFCLIASAVYVVNDIIDVEKDRQHPVKKNRPIASGKISIPKAIIVFIILIILGNGIQTAMWYFQLIDMQQFIRSIIFLLAYLSINIFYSVYAKKVPVLDIIILALGFLLRVYYGGCVIDVQISSWLYMTILAFALYLVLGKRRGELKKVNTNSREVLKYYNMGFLDKTMYVFLGLTLVFYSLWCIISSNPVFNSDLLMYSIIFVIFAVLRYSLIVEGDSFADPVDVVLSDKLLMLTMVLYVIYMGVAIYV